MKKTIVSLLVSCIVLPATSGVFVLAQTQEMTASIPFEFLVGKTALPAGEYEVSRVSSGSAALLIRSVDGKSAAMVITHGAPAGSREDGRLVFHRYGNRYFLSQVFSPGSDIGRQIPKSTLERELASNPQRPTMEYVALRGK